MLRHFLVNFFVRELCSTGRILNIICLRPLSSYMCAARADGVVRWFPKQKQSCHIWHLFTKGEVVIE